MTDQVEVTIYTDGACKGNPGPGGCAALLIAGQYKKALTQEYPHDTTNNTMELQAILMGLVALKTPSSVIVYTDSQDAIDWLLGTAKTKKAHIQVLIDAINETVKQGHHMLGVGKIDAHASSVLNTYVDQLASDAAYRAMSIREGIEAGQVQWAE
jgi:ribonuclease HI